MGSVALMLERILILINTSRFDDAEVAIQNELAKEPNNSFLYLYLGRVYTAQRKFKAAENATLEALANDPDLADAYWQLAQIHRERGKTSEGHKAIDQALNLDPEDADYHGMKAAFFIDKHDWQRALERTEMGLELDAENENCLFYRGIALAKLGREGEAEENSLKLLEVDAEDGTHHESRGWVLLESGKAAEAGRCFTEALRIDPASEEAKAGLIQTTIHQHPAVGWLLRFLKWTDRIAWWILLIGMLVIGRISRVLEANESTAALGIVLKSAMVIFIILWVASSFLFEIVLLVNKDTRHAIKDRHVSGVKWAMPFITLGLIAVGYWMYGGAKFQPLLAYAVLSVGLCVREVFQSDNRWVRKCYFGLVVAMMGVAAFSAYAQYFIISPYVVETLVELAKSKADADAIEEALDQLLRMRNWYVFYPSCALLLIACYRDEITCWLEGRAPDEAWE